MVVSIDVIKRNKFFSVTWVLATGDTSKVSRKEILGQNVSNICESIIEMAPKKDESSKRKAGLYILSMLTYGTVLVHRVQVDFLQRDVEKLKELLKRKSFIMLLAEKFDREQAEKRKNERRGSKLRSQPIGSIEEIDSWVNLADLQMISDNLGINGDVREFTMMDAIPNPPLDWSDLNADNVGLYGAVDQFSQKNLTMHSTFVEGNGSDQRDRLADAVLFNFDDIVTPRPLPVKPAAVDEQRRRSSHQPEPAMRPQEPVEEIIPPVVKETVEPEAQETLKYAQCLLSEPVEHSVQDSVFERPQEATVMLQPETPLANQQEMQLQTPHEPLLEEQKELDEPSKLHQQEQVQEKLQQEPEFIPQEPSLLRQPPREPFPQFEDLDVPNVSRAMQDKVAAFYEQVANLPDGSVALPPPPQEDPGFIGQPPPKKQKIGDEDVEVELEKARKRASSRPMTPVTPLNRTDLTNLQTSIRPEEEEEEEVSFKLDSQIRGPLPLKKKSKRNLPPIYGDDLEIDKAVQKALLADWSSLVRKKQDVLVKVPAKIDTVCADMFIPAPFFGLGRRIAEEIPDVFRTGIYRDYVATEIESEERIRNEETLEDSLKFATVSLLPSDETQQQIEEEQRTRLFDLVFEEPPRDTASLLLQPQFEQPQEDIVPKDTEPAMKFAQTYLRSESPLEIEQNRQQESNDTLKFAAASLIPRISEEYAQEMKFVQVSLLPTPEKIAESRIIEELQLEPIPAGNNTDALDYSHRMSAAVKTQENMENPRRNHKSSLGIRSQRLEDLEQDAEYQERLREKQVQMRFANNLAEEDPFVFSSGSLLPNNRFKIHEELLTEAKEKYPDWVDFNEFTALFTRKKAATSFEGLLLNLKNLILRVKQEEPYGTIFVQHMEEKSFDETQQSPSLSL